MSVRIWKWNDSYVGFSFTCTTERDEAERPQCMICNLVMSNGNWKPSALREHLRNKYSNHVGTSVDAFKLRRIRYDLGKPLLEASSKVLYTITKEKKSHTIGETLLKPCVLEMAKIALGEDAVKQLSQVSLSNDTVHQRIKDTSQDITTQVVSEMKQNHAKISMQIEESTDVSKHSQ
ncbi:protein FAM200C-like [Oratosquilla oratoria]|uniref:protein FAM200C-like n=1 Tax=Oratosquilla oratoria TaxID=337810 RepID=UPI003F776100